MTSSVSSVRPRPSSRRTSSSSGTFSSTTTSMSSSRSASSWSREFDWLRLRGKPSRTKPLVASSSARRSRIIAMVTLSGTRSPASMYRLASSPIGVSAPGRRLARNRSPLEMCGTSKRSARRTAWVPLPAPGGPTRRRRTRHRPPELDNEPNPTDRPTLTQETVVLALHELALDLLDGVEAHSDHDQHSGAPEGEVLVLTRAGDAEEEVRQHGDDAEVQRTGQRDAGKDVLQVLGRRPARADARDEPAEPLHLVGPFLRVE